MRSQKYVGACITTVSATALPTYLPRYQPSIKTMARDLLDFRAVAELRNFQQTFLRPAIEWRLIDAHLSHWNQFSLDQFAFSSCL